MSTDTKTRVELTHMQLVVVAVLAAGLLLCSLKLLGPYAAHADESAPGLHVPLDHLTNDRTKASGEAPDFGPVDLKAVEPGKKSVLDIGPINLDNAVFIERPDLSPTCLDVLPQLAMARTRPHRIVELEFTHQTDKQPVERTAEAIRVETAFGPSKELLLEKSYRFLLADELKVTKATGELLATKEVLEHLQAKKPVLLIHVGTKLPEHYVRSLGEDALIVSIPREPKVYIKACDLEGPKTKKADSYVSSSSLPLTTYPELCTASSKELGIVELCCSELKYGSTPKRGERAVSIITREGQKDLLVDECKHSVLASEIGAYRPDGTPVTREELLYSLTENTALFAVLGPEKPPAQYLSMLSEDAIVAHLPYEQLIKLRPKRVSKSSLADDQNAGRYYARN